MISKLEQYSAEQVARILKYEHPQVIAVILSRLNPNFVAQLFKHFCERLCSDIALRMVTIHKVNRVWLEKLDECIIKELDTVSDVVDIKNYECLGILDEEIQVSIMNGIREYDPELADIVTEQLNSKNI